MSLRNEQTLMEVKSSFGIHGRAFRVILLKEEKRTLLDISRCRELEGLTCVVSDPVSPIVGHQQIFEDCCLYIRTFGGTKES